MQTSKFDEFIRITKKLNEINIIPLLMGSVGLEISTNTHWNAQDLDIHVPGDSRGWAVSPDQNIHHWKKIITIMNNLGYELIDLHEHAFLNNNDTVEFGIIDTLPSFAKVDLKDLELHQTNGAKYFLLTPVQYLKVYQASAKDSYRNQNNNSKDFNKIDYLKKNYLLNEQEVKTLIRIKRNTGSSGMLGKIKIYIDGEEAARIKQDQQIELELPNEEVTITATQFGSRSNELVVKNGQVVEITNSSWLYAYYAFVFVAIFLLLFFVPDAYRSIGYLILLAIAAALLVFKNVFEIKVIYP